MTDLSSVSGLRGVREALEWYLDAIFWCTKHEAAPDTDWQCNFCNGYRAHKPDCAYEKHTATLRAALSLPPSPQPVSDAEQLVWRACDLLERAKEAMECDPQADVVGEDCWTWIKQTEIWLDELNRTPAGAQGQVQGVQATPPNYAGEPFPHPLDCVCATCIGADVSSQAGQPSRSVQRRIALQKGEPMPEFIGSEIASSIALDGGTHRVCNSCDSDWPCANHPVACAGGGQEGLRYKVPSMGEHGKRERKDGLIDCSCGAGPMHLHDWPGHLSNYSHNDYVTLSLRDFGRLATALKNAGFLMERIIGEPNRDEAALLPPASKPPAEPQHPLRTEILRINKFSDSYAITKAEGWSVLVELAEKELRDAVRRASLERESK